MPESTSEQLQLILDVSDQSTVTQIEFEEENDTEPVVSIGRNVIFSRSERRIRDLKGDIDEGLLDPSPSFQRQYVWDDRKASLLIESMLLNVPIPVIFTAEEHGMEIVIDGRQRITSAIRFLNNEFPLRGLKIFKDEENKYYRDLSHEYKGKVGNYSISIVKISEDSDEEVKFEIFERINSGSVVLNEQEIRNCIFRGHYNEFLKVCSEENLLQQLLFGDKTQKRMEDVQMVLRFFSFYSSGIATYPGRLVTFLNNHMKDQRRIYQLMDDSERERSLLNLKDVFKKSLDLSMSVFGDKSFKTCTLKQDQTLSWGKVNKSLFDVVMWGFTLFDKSQVMPKCDAIREALINLITTDERFLPRDGTLQRDAVRYRFNRWQSELESIISSPRQPRSFSYSIKQELFLNDQTCTLCGQQIQTLDDSEVHHHEPYWRGGETIPENARLVHRYCNRRIGGRTTM